MRLSKEDAAEVLILIDQRIETLGARQLRAQERSEGFADRPYCDQRSPRGRVELAELKAMILDLEAEKTRLWNLRQRLTKQKKEQT